MTQFKDDLDGTEAVETVPFSIDGMAFEIDLSEDNAARFRGVMAEFVLAARRPVKAKPKARKRESKSGYDVQKVRAWWRDIDWQAMSLPAFNAKGRIPADVRNAAVVAGIIPALDLAA
jgi:hypothetical protein